ncbi:hypothetical protein ACN24M_03765 [Streptomyces microflavus]
MNSATVYVPAPDGTPLATDLCLPDAPGPHPAVVIRTHGRTAHHAELRGWAATDSPPSPRTYAAARLTGSVAPLRETREGDGAATVAWVREQTWSGGGPVVAAGSSYAAHCALVTALGTPGDGRPDAVIAAVPALGLAETAREPAGRNGPGGWWAAPDSAPDALAHALADDPGSWNTSRSPGWPTASAAPCPPGPASGTRPARPDRPARRRLPPPAPRRRRHPRPLRRGHRGTVERLGRTRPPAPRPVGPPPHRGPARDRGRPHQPRCAVRTVGPRRPRGGWSPSAEA